MAIVNVLSSSFVLVMLFSLEIKLTFMLFSLQ